MSKITMQQLEEINKIIREKRKAKDLIRVLSKERGDSLKIYDENNYSHSIDEWAKEAFARHYENMITKYDERLKELGMEIEG